MPNPPETVVAVKEVTVFASTASEQPSPSLSKSNRFGIPSPSVSNASLADAGLLVHKYPEPASMTIKDRSVARSAVCAMAIVCVVAVATNDNVTSCCVA